MTEQRVPTWRLREELRRQATETIEGRANFERHTGRLSTKPLKQIELDPREVLQLVDDPPPPPPADERLREKVARAICGADGMVNWTEKIPAKYWELADVAIEATRR